MTTLTESKIEAHILHKNDMLFAIIFLIFWPLDSLEDPGYSHTERIYRGCAIV